VDKKIILLTCDLYWLLFDPVTGEKLDAPWYELTDYLRGKLTEDGHKVKYTRDDVIIDGLSAKGAIERARAKGMADHDEENDDAA